MPELWGRDPSGVSRKLRELHGRSADGVSREFRELWGRDGSGVNRKIFLKGIQISGSPTSFCDNWGSTSGSVTWILSNSYTNFTIDSAGLTLNALITNVGSNGGNLRTADFGFVCDIVFDSTKIITGFKIDKSFNAYRYWPIPSETKDSNSMLIAWDWQNTSSAIIPNDQEIYTDLSMGAGSMLPQTQMRSTPASLSELFIFIGGHTSGLHVSDDKNIYCGFTVVVPDGAISLLSDSEEIAINFS